MSDLLCNYKRHCACKHNIAKSQSVIPTQNVAENAQNVALATQNVAENAQNVALATQNVAQYICTNCDKEFKQKRYLTRHEKTCKGIFDSLECHICHSIFTTRYSKSRHLQKCKISLQAIIPTNDTPLTNTNVHNGNIINNSGTINNTANITENTENITNNTINNNTVTNNINIVTFKPESSDCIEFDTSHITNEVLKEILSLAKETENGEKHMVEHYTRNILSNPANRCIKKTNMRSVHSKIHIGNNKWETKHDLQLYPKFVCDVANGFDELIKQRYQDDKRLIDKKTLKEFERFLDYMSDNGYCNDETLGKEMHHAFKHIVHRVKAIVYDITQTITNSLS